MSHHPNRHAVKSFRRGANSQALQAHNGHPHAVTGVAMDVSPANVRGGQENCRNAQIVFDKFHVIDCCAAHGTEEGRTRRTRSRKIVASDD
jgi:transposase